MNAIPIGALSRQSGIKAPTTEPQSSCDMTDSIALQHLVDECSRGPVLECRIIEALTDNSQCRDDIART